MSPSIGRSWIIVRLRSHIRKHAREWTIGSVCAAAWIALIVAVKLLGGPSEKGVKVFPVVGRVLLEGQPLRGGYVKFHADASKDNSTQIVPSSEIDADGNYVLHTGSQRGAPPGWYRVVIVPSETDDNSKAVSKDFKPPFNVKFTRDDLTPLQVEVKENATYDLELTK
jgi:hypothetical protein